MKWKRPQLNVSKRCISSQEAPVNFPKTSYRRSMSMLQNLHRSKRRRKLDPLVTAFVSTHASENCCAGAWRISSTKPWASAGNHCDDSGSPEREGDIVVNIRRTTPTFVISARKSGNHLRGMESRGQGSPRKYVVNANTTMKRKIFERLAQCLEANPGASIVGGDIVYSTQPTDTFPPSM